MPENYQHANLHGQSFKGKDLHGVDFSYANIRGANFTNARLVAANFSHCRAGLPHRWSVGLVVGSLLLTIIFGAIAGYASTVADFVRYPPVENFDVLQQQILPWVALVLFLSWLGILFQRGLGAALAAFALGVVIAVVAVAALASDVEIGVTTLLLMFGLAGATASVIGLATALVVLICTTDQRWHWAFLVAAVVGALPGVWEGVVAFADPEDRGNALPASLLVAGVVAIVLLATSMHIGRRAITGDKKYALIQRFVTTLLTSLGTRLRGADLTDADFTGAVLENSDLREAVMIRTDWFQVQALDRARTERTYLANAQVRQLAVSKDGRNQNFNHLNLQGLNLTRANLTDASFISTNLGEATLREADLSRAKLVHTQFHDTDLRGACLTGAYIEDWGISTNTQFNDVRCDYVYMRLPTQQDPDPWRKPDNRDETFQVGDFADFMTPIIKTLDLYRRQDIDLRTVGRAFKTLDLFHYNGIDPSVTAIALKQLAAQHPEAGLTIVALEGLDRDKIRLQATVSENADRSALSATYAAIYDSLITLPRRERQALLADAAQQDTRIAGLANFVLTAIQNEKVFIETHIHLGDPMPNQIICLFLAANPFDMQPLNLAREIREIKAKIRAAEFRDALQLVSEWAVRPDDLLQSLNTYKPKIVHFSGHGTNTGEIILEDDQGAAKPVSAHALKMLFTTLKDNLRLVFFNACYAENQAYAITEVIDCAIGMRSPISDAAATTFAASFYRAIGFGRSIQAAFDQGITALLLEGIAEEDTPQLLTRTGVDPASIILIEVKAP